jgi:hypothetical protein
MLRNDTRVSVPGIQTREDTRLAIRHGVAGIVVSNHGGRQLDAGCVCASALAAGLHPGSSQVELDTLISDSKFGDFFQNQN